MCASSVQLIVDKTDSRRTLLAKEKSDTSAVNLRLKIASTLIEKDSAHAEKEFHTVVDLLQKQNNKIFTLKSYKKAGRIFYSNDQLNSGHSSFLKGKFDIVL